MDWATKRKLIYFLGFVFVVLVFVGVPAFALLYKQPTCFDGKKNQGEEGIDCSGPCVKLCKTFDLEPVVVWQQTLEVVNGVYTAVAYVQNPNINTEATHVPYTFSFYDTAGNLVTTKKGVTYIPPGRSFAIYEPYIISKDTKIVRTLFEFDKEYNWYRARKNQPEPVLKNQLLTNASTSPSIDVDLYNPTFSDFPRVDVTAIVYNSDGNAFAASKTIIRNLDRQTMRHIIFSWPNPFPVKTEVCQVPTDVILGIDRSGSMASDGSNPPEPLTSVKNAAVTFVNVLQSKDKIGVISFATEPTLDQELSSDLTSIRGAIDRIAILPTGTQYTNVSDTLKKALEEFQSPRHTSDSKKTVVLLTDGIATYPEKKGDDAYPATLALEQAEIAKSQNVEIYTIGLGQKLDTDFLKNLASSEKHYYSAITSNDVENVYSQVAQALCNKQAARVELIATVPPVER